MVQDGRVTEPIVRRYRPEDIEAIRDICIRTGDAGADATARFARPVLLPLIYAEPYVVHDPDLAFVVDDESGRAAGYVLGTADVAAFEEWEAQNWWPHMREAYPAESADEGTPDARLIDGHFYGDDRTEAALLAEYPAELHIDLLPSVQGGGRGRLLIEAFIGELRARGVAGVHLGVDGRNTNAIGFYRHLGFSDIRDEPWGAVLGLRLG